MFEVAMPVCENINGLNCLLELGKWTPTAINLMLSNAKKNHSDPSIRLHWIMQNFNGTKFEFESMSENPPKGTLRVRLESMDCITYIYNMLALCKASNFNEYVSNLYNLRYLANDRQFLDSNPDTGNILDFAEESLLLNAVNIGILKDITEEVICEEDLINISVNISRFQRYSIYDKNTSYVTPRFGERLITERFIPVDSIDKIDKSKLKNGDIILLSEGAITKKGVTSPVLISHLAITHLENDEIYFYHATRHFYWRPDANSTTPPSYTGVFLDKERKKEIIGTAHAGIFAGEETKTEYNDLIYFGLNQKIMRPLSDFAGRLFKGIKIVRVI